MKHVLVLGAGLVAGPLVQYLLDRPDLAVVVADVDVGRASKLVGGRPRGAAEFLDIGDRTALASAIGRSDLVVSMVPYTFHPLVAELAIEQGKSMVTASYVSPGMRALDAKARARGVILLNELGLDPGIDHMEAMRVASTRSTTTGAAFSPSRPIAEVCRRPRPTPIRSATSSPGAREASCSRRRIRPSSSRTAGS